MKRLAIALMLGLFVSPVKANMVTVSFEFEGTISDFFQDQFIFPGRTSPITPIGGIQDGDAFTATGQFTFDPNQSPLGIRWQGNYEAVIVVDGHTFATQGAMAAPRNQMTADAHEVAFEYNTDPIDGSNQLASTLDTFGNGVYPTTAIIDQKIIADLGTFQHGTIGFTFAQSVPDQYRYDLSFGGNVTLLRLTTPEPSTFGTAALGLLGMIGLAWRRQA